MLKNQKGFTLVEMLVVMLIITVLLILIIPNLTNQTNNVNDKGCQALAAVVQAQADAYYLDKGSYASSINDLLTNDYIDESQTSCNNDTRLILSNGKVILQ